MTSPEELLGDDLDRAIADEIARARAQASKPPRSRSAATNAQRAQQLETEYHLARLLILINEIAGAKGSIRGLTKLAKLDFLLRYPVFLEKLAEGGTVPVLTLDESTIPTPEERRAVESRMIRYKYGPWDDKYYGLIGSLVGRGLAEYVDADSGFALRLTKGGRDVARTLAKDRAWVRTAARCRALRRAFARTSGNRLKELIYSQLPDAVDRPYRMEI